MKRAGRRICTGLSALAGGLICFCLLARSAYAQQEPRGGGVSGAGGTPRALVVRGRVVDAAGAGLSGRVVALHQVTDAGGAAVAEAMSGPDGRFEIALADAADDAVYFAATRYEGGLYIGPPFRLPVPDGREYAIVVDGSAAQGFAAASGGPGGPAWTRGESLAIVVALAAGGLALALAGSRPRRPDARRALLLELAALEERLDGRDGELDPAERAAHDRRREALRDRLRGVATR